MGKYVIKKTKVGFFFNLEAANGQVIATSQVYTTKPSCKSGIESLKKIANSPIENKTIKGFKELPKPKYEVYQDRKKEFRFRLISSNGKIVIYGEGYSTMQACQAGVLSVQSNVHSDIEDTSVVAKPAAKKAPAKKSEAKKSRSSATTLTSSANGTRAKKATTDKKPAVKKTAEKKTAAKKTPAKKPAAKKAPAKKAPAKKTPAKKPVAKKAPAKKAPAKKVKK